MTLAAGTRVRFCDTSPWPERRGCTGTVVVAPNGSGCYPDDPRDRKHVIVLLDDDPLGATRNGWTCVVGRDDIEVIA